jgi:hypothetical protein
VKAYWEAGHGQTRGKRVLPHAVGIVWVIGAAMLALAPALHHGLSLGPYDILSQSGLTQASGVTPRNSASGDQIAEMIPWSSLAWTQVHAGHLPLWNPFSGLGLPLAFNWQSAVFSLPVVISYAFPLHLAYTAQIVVTLVIAGTGAYALARVLHVGAIGCATAGTIYELSGSFMGWLGWPHAAVMSWAGWLLAVAILLVRGKNRTRNIALFAVIFALAIYSGQPEILTILAVSVIVFVLTMVIVNARATHNLRGSLPPLVALFIAVVAGTALGAPLALPGLQVLSRSTRNSGTLLAQTEVGKALPPHDLVHLVVQGYNGLPIAGNQVFGDAVYFDTAAYVGVIGFALAVLGVVWGRRRPEVVAFAVLTVVTLAIVFAPPVEALLLHLPLFQTIDWHRDLMMLGLCVAILAGVGMDAVVRAGNEKMTQLALAVVSGSSLAALLVLRVVSNSGLSPLDARLRNESLIWPLATAGLILVIVGFLAAQSLKVKPSRNFDADRLAFEPADGPSGVNGISDSARRRPMSRPGQVTGGVLLLLETAFLVASGAQLWPSSAHGVTSTPSVTVLRRTVGDSTVGFGAFTCFAGPAVTGLGILPESNSLFAVHEFDFYDPIFPQAYLKSWAAVSRSAAGVPIYNSFCPALTRASQARRFGVEFVLESVGAARPKGAILDRRIGDEDLYRIPDSGEATLTPEFPAGRVPPVDALGTPVKVEHPSPSSWRIVTTGHGDQVLRLRLTDEPGWRATIDGHPLVLSSYAGVMMQAHVPAGRHVIEVEYWPSLFTLGLVLAGCCGVLLVASSALALKIRRSERGGHD